MISGAVRCAAGGIPLITWPMECACCRLRLRAWNYSPKRCWRSVIACTPAPMNAPLCWPRWATPMREHNDQATLETALNWLGLGMMGLLLVLVPVIVLVPAMRAVNHRAFGALAVPRRRE